MRQICFITVVLLIFYGADFLLTSNEQSFTFLSKRHTTILKGVAIFTVVWGHMTAQLGIKHIQMIAEIGVWTFLFCSGYGCMKSAQKSGIKGFWRRRFLKIILPFWICELIGLIFTKRFTLHLYIMDVTFVKAATSYGWFMGYLMLYYIAFWLLEKTQIVLKRRESFALKGIMIFAVFIFIYFSTVSVNPLFPALRARQILAFPLGMFAADGKNYFATLIKWVSSKSKERIGAVDATLLISGGGWKLITKYLETRMPYLISNMTALLAATLCGIAFILLSVCCKKLFSKRYFFILGKYSFSIYMVHAFTLNLLNRNLSGSIAFLPSTGVLCVILQNTLIKAFQR